jgi:hypothetical protein
MVTGDAGQAYEWLDHTFISNTLWYYFKKAGLSRITDSTITVVKSVGHCA